MARTIGPRPEGGSGKAKPAPVDPARRQRTRHLALVAGLLALAVVLVGWQVMAARARNARMQQMARGGPGGPGGPGGGRGRMERMIQELNLTEAQKTQLEAIRKEYEPKLQALRNLSPEQRREQGRAIHQEQRGRIRQILTPEQQAKFDTMRGRGGRGGGGGGGRGGRGGGGGGGGWQAAPGQPAPANPPAGGGGEQ